MSGLIDGLPYYTTDAYEPYESKWLSRRQVLRALSGDETVEMLARAIYEEDMRQAELEDEIDWEHEKNKQWYLGEARAVLRVLVDPTENKVPTVLEPAPSAETVAQVMRVTSTHPDELPRELRVTFDPSEEME